MYPFTIYEDCDANDMLKSEIRGFYNAEHIPEHIPYEGNGFILVLNGGPYIFQLLIAINGQSLYFRYGTFGYSWSAWYKISTTMVT